MRNGRSGPAADFGQDFVPVLPIGHGDRDPQRIEDFDEVVGVEMGIDRGVEDVVNQTGEVGAGGLDAVFSIDGHPGRSAVFFAHGVKGTGDFPQAPLDLFVGPLDRGGGGHILE